MRKSLINTLEIHTPEGVVFALPLAGPFKRFAACAIDLACIATITSTFVTIISPFNIITPDIYGMLLYLGVFIISMGYAIVLEWFWRGQTLGKRIMRIRVMDENGLRLQFGQVVIRNLFRTVDMLPALYGLGGIICLLNRHWRRLGDIAAGTIVVRHIDTSVKGVDTLERGKFNSFRAYPHIEARLRQRISPQTAGLGLQALMRRETLDPESRLKLFKELADYYRSLADFPEEATFALTDEQYVRNVIETIFPPAQ
jgi:uncharacterized RDD family membrane protein YckC